MTPAQTLIKTLQDESTQIYYVVQSDDELEIRYTTGNNTDECYFHLYKLMAQDHVANFKVTPEERAWFHSFAQEVTGMQIKKCEEEAKQAQEQRAIDEVKIEEMKRKLTRLIEQGYLDEFLEQLV